MAAICAQNKALPALSYLLMNQPYNPILWELYSTCRFLHSYKPTLNQHEIQILDYYGIGDNFWLKGGFEDIRDFIAIDDQTDATTEIEAITNIPRKRYG